MRADGAIVPCSMLAHIELGRINHDSLPEVWQHSPALNSLRTRSTIPLNDFAFCAGCDYMPYCTGNCPGAGLHPDRPGGPPQPGRLPAAIPGRRRMIPDAASEQAPRRRPA